MLVEPSHAEFTGRELLPPPARPWRWRQVWRDVLFAHWNVPADALRRQLPHGVELDLWEGAAWVSAVAFRLERVRLRGLPAFWPVSNLLELNLRTYVRCRGEPGIHFLSMHADNRLAMAFARMLTPLPYLFARIAYLKAEISDFKFEISNRRATLPLLHAAFEPRGELHFAAPDSLEAWLLERYRAFVPRRNGALCRMVVEHSPWQMQDAALTCFAPRLGEPWGLSLERQPDLWQFSTGLAAHVWPFDEWK